MICHDAGGAEIVSSYCKKVRGNFIFTLEGPAQEIFSRKLGSITNRDLTTTIQNAEEIITGTSGKSNLERLAIKMARDRNLESRSFLDHWINYELRFTDEEGVMHLPDTLIVGDEYAEKLAMNAFPGHKIQLIPNPYWESITKDWVSVTEKQKESQSCIYVSEGLDEFDSDLRTHLDVASIDIKLIRELQNNLSSIDSQLRRIVIRRHPAEPKDKFDSFISEMPEKVLMSKSYLELVEELSGYTTVVGYQSMALVIALQMGLRVISIRLQEMPEIQLPFKEIERLVLIT